jgi:hypothetical protein
VICDEVPARVELCGGTTVVVWYRETATTLSPVLAPTPSTTTFIGKNVLHFLILLISGVACVFAAPRLMMTVAFLTVAQLPV